MNTTLWIIIAILTSLSFFILDNNRVDYERCSHNRIRLARGIRVFGLCAIIPFPCEFLSTLIDGFFLYICNIVCVFVAFALGFLIWNILIYVLYTTEENLTKKILKYKEAVS